MKTESNKPKKKSSNMKSKPQTEETKSSGPLSQGRLSQCSNNSQRKKGKQDNSNLNKSQSSKHSDASDDIGAINDGNSNGSVEATTIERQVQQKEVKVEVRKKKVADKVISTPVAIINITPSQKKNVMFTDTSVLAKDSGETNTSSSASFENTPKRSKSEANRDQFAFMVMISKARKNLFRTRKLSPMKLNAQITEKQERAENLRQSIATTRRVYLEKVKQRHQEARIRCNEMLQIKNANTLQDIKEKQEQAAERKQAEIQNVVEKAKAENVKFEETNYINKMTKLNQLLDLDSKMSETEERRLFILQNKVRGIGLKQEAFDKRRRQLSEVTKTKFLTNQQKREQAEERRRNRFMAEKTKAREDKIKRDLVRARKCFNFNKINEIMTFVNDSESLWELIAIEQEIENLGMHHNANTYDGLQNTPFLMKAYDALVAATDDQQSRDLLRLLNRDQFELEKLMLKRDQEILDRCIRFDQNGKLTITQSPMMYMQRTNADTDQSSSGSDERKSNNSFQPTVFKRISQPLKSVSINRIETKKNFVADEYFETQLQQQRLKMSMRRNILRRTLSEDLQWADCIKNDPSFKALQCIAQKRRTIMTAHSLRSTPERRILNVSPPSPQFLQRDYKILKSEDKLVVRQQKLAGETPKHMGKKNKKKKNQPNPNQITLLAQNKQLKVLSPITQSSKFQDLQEIPRNYVLQQDQIKMDAKGKAIKLFEQKSNNLLEVRERRNSNQDGDLVQTSSLNQQSLEQLGPVQKMSFNGFHFHQRDLQILTNQFGGQLSQTNSGQQSPHESEPHYSTQSLQMNQLILNQKTIASNKISALFTSNNLSKNAQLILFPIREQKLLLMNKEKNNSFAQVKIFLKLTDVSKFPLTSVLQPTKQKTTDSIEAITGLTPTKPKVESAQKTTPKKEGKEEKKELKLVPVLQVKKSIKRSDTNRDSKSMLQKEDDENLDSNRKSENHKNNLLTKSLTLLPTIDDSIDNDVCVTRSEDEQRQIIDFLIKHVLVDCQKEIKHNDSQKSILLDFPESSRVIDFLELVELGFLYCRLCESFICETITKAPEAVRSIFNEHFTSKSHIKTREDLNIKEVEDQCFSMLQFASIPGDTAEEVHKEKEKALKRSAARLKKQIQECSVQHENASTYPGKELQSTHKKRLQIRCIELEKSVFPQIQNYDTVEAILNDVIKVMELKKIADLHLMRKLKFIPTLIDMCKRISMCPRQELKHLGKALGLVIKIIQQFCSLRENRNYMLQTNRLMPLIELFNWCLNRSTEIFFGIDFLPNLFNILSSHLRHRVPYECQQLKELTVDYLISSTITAKLKSKHAIIKQIPLNELQESMGQIPFFLLKSTTFLEALTAMISIDARTRPIYEKSYKIGEHVFFVLQQTELFGIIQMITTLLLTCNETFKTSSPQNTMILPQTVLSLAIVSVKVLNNILRMDFRIVHQIMTTQDEQLYFLLNFLLSYAEANIENSDDVKELLHETLIFIGYFSLLNNEHQNLLQRGENCIIKKLCNLPFTYFFDKRLKEILFPTLICATFQNQRSLAIVDQEMDLNTLVKYLDTSIEEELPKIIELEQEELSEQAYSMNSLGHETKPKTRAQSPSASSISSNSAQSVCMDFLSGNNPYLPLTMRFPKRALREASKFIGKKD